MISTDYRALIGRSMTEDELQSAVEDTLDLFGWTWHHAGDSRRSTAGLPDIVAVRVKGDDARIIFAELKSAKGSLRPAQKPWVNLVGQVEAETGGRVQMCVWRPIDWLHGTIERVLR